MDLNQARENLITGQVQACGVLDPRILELYHKLPRESFMPPGYSRLALAETPIPLGHGQQSMTPTLEARMLQALAPVPGEQILEIGTGSGYVTALLAGLGGTVTSMDIHADFSTQARAKLDPYDLLAKTRLLTCNALEHWPVKNNFDVIAVTGSLPEFRGDWLDRLHPGGRLFVVLGTAPVMQATLYSKLPAVRREWLFETELPALTGSDTQSVFHF